MFPDDVTILFTNNGSTKTEYEFYITTVNMPHSLNFTIEDKIMLPVKKVSAYHEELIFENCPYLPLFFQTFKRVIN